MKSAWMLLALLAGTVSAQNSTTKVRPEPSELAARAGSAVKWRDSLDTAIAESRETGRPVFWYVPTAQRSPMDRQAEVDRYMMAGPFSWPTTIRLLNDAYIPVRMAAPRALQKRYGIAPRAFIEPGYLVLDGNGEELARLDEITTFERVWFETPLAALVGRELEDSPIWRWLRGPRDREPAAREGGYRIPDELPANDEQAAELLFVRGLRAYNERELGGSLPMGTYQPGQASRTGGANAAWSELVERFPDQPIAWKAAAELEGHGPYRYGFEVFRELPAAAIAGPHDGSRAAPGAYTEQQLRELGLRFLRRLQRTEGGITDSRYDFGGTDSLPNVWVACTALAAMAALAHDQEHTPFYDYALNDDRLNIDDTDELVWARIYRARLLCRLVARHAQDEGYGYARALEDEVAHLCAMQSKGGAWSHEYANPFVTASVLLALHEARAQGVSADEKFIERGLRALATCRAESGAVSYGMPRRGEVRTSVEAASCRMPLIEAALLAWGASDQQRLRAAIDAAFEHHDTLAEVRKYDDHANRLGHGGFFFWYDIHSRAEAISLVADEELRANYRARQRAQVLALPEIDGCFVDSHELGKGYGTAMALLTLAALK